MTGYEPRISGVGSDRSSNCPTATATAQHANFLIDPVYWVEIKFCHLKLFCISRGTNLSHRFIVRLYCVYHCPYICETTIASTIIKFALAKKIETFYSQDMKRRLRLFVVVASALKISGGILEKEREWNKERARERAIEGENDSKREKQKHKETERARKRERENYSQRERERDIYLKKDRQRKKEREWVIWHHLTLSLNARASHLLMVTLSP